MGLLEFVSASGKRRIRAYVGSANLTPSGTCTNIELVVSDECAATSTTPRLVADVAAALKTAVPGMEMAPAHRSQTKAVLAAIAARLKCPPAGAVAHSLNAETPLVGALGAPRAADRLIIISPPFAGEGDHKAAAALAPWIGADTSVTLMTQCGNDGRLRFSSAAITELRKATGPGKLEIRAVPLDPVVEGEVQRRLHAKLVAVVHGRQARVLVGSANFSRPGLLGGNREAVVALDMSAADLDRFLGELSSEPHRGPVAKQRPTTYAHGGPVLPITAVFSPNSALPVELANMRGRLRINAGALEILDVFYDGEALVGWRDRDVAIREDVGVVQVVVVHDGTPLDQTVPIEIEASEDQLEDWPVGDRPTPLTELERILGTIRVAKARRASDAAGPKDKPLTPMVEPDDKLIIPLEQRLVLLARHREQVAPVLRAYWESDKQLLAELLEPDELRVASALFGLAVDDSSSVLRALFAAEPALHLLRSET